MSDTKPVGRITPLSDKPLTRQQSDRLIFVDNLNKMRNELTTLRAQNELMTDALKQITYHVGCVEIGGGAKQAIVTIGKFARTALESLKRGEG